MRKLAKFYALPSMARGPWKRGDIGDGVIATG
jgi:hypothetical protein